jgi:hypothetical protein
MKSTHFIRENNPLIYVMTIFKNVTLFYEFYGWSLKSTLFSLYLRKFLRTLKLKKYPFSEKKSYTSMRPVRSPECGGGGGGGL